MSSAAADAPSGAHDARPTGALLRAALFAAAYFGGSELGYALSLGPAVGGTFWPPAGISLAVLLLSSTRTWPLLLAAGASANFLSDLYHGQTLPASVGFVIANLSEPLLGAFLLRRRFAAPIAFTRLPEIVALALVVVFVSAPLAAAIGAATAEWFAPTPPGFAAGWRTWWVGDAVGALVLTPLVVRVIAERHRLRGVSWRTWLEATAFTLIVWIVTELVFSAPPLSIAMPFLVFPVLLWGSVRLGPIAVGGALCLIVVLTAHDTADGQGPFAAEHLALGERLVALQIYVGVMALSFHTLGVLWDERARTAAALRAAHSGLEARYRRIVEQSPLAIAAIQPGGRIQDANPAWQRLWMPGAPEAAQGNDSWHPRLEPTLHRAFAGEVVELPQRNIVVESDSRGPRRLRGFAYPVKDEAGGVAEVVVIERDITDEVAAQQQLVDANRALREREEALSHALQQMAEAQAHREQLLEAERLARADAERALQLKDEFLATLSHELRTPLNAIIGWAHILRRSARDSALAPAVDTIERNALAQAKLIDDLLDMSRIIAGKLNLTARRTRLDGIITGAADALQPLAAAKGVTVAVDTAQARDVSIVCDVERLQQVVTNLVGNGIKFTPQGGRVDVRVSCDGDWARMVVRDTGQGIRAEFLPHVFERFRQADGSITRRHGGLGLGLSIARHIVEMHGGTISAESDGPGHGAAFTVSLPLDAAGAHLAPAQEADWTQMPARGLRVLVVDDEPDARELFRQLLAEQGCHVGCAASADEALRALAGGSWHVLLTDIGMPDTDGFELLRRVRAENHGPLKAIAVTAFARPEDRERALAAGFEDHLAKPVSPAQLLHTLARITGSVTIDPTGTVPPGTAEPLPN